MLPLVTIAIPAYKSKYIKIAIDSAIKQTYKNIEIIIVDDSPTDTIKDIVKEFNDSRIKYFKNTQNLGKENPAKNWNKCIEYASGDFFSLLCDDDYYEPTFIEELLNLANKYTATKVFRSRVKIIDEYDNILNYYPSVPEWESFYEHIWHMVNNYRCQTISEFLYRKTVLEEYGGFSYYPKAWCADRISIYKFSQFGGIASTNKILTGFRMSGINISSESSKDIIDKIKAQILCTKDISSLISNIDNKRLIDTINKKRKIQERNIISEYLTNANINDYIYIWKHRKKDFIEINNKTLVKSLIKRIIRAFL